MGRPEVEDFLKHLAVEGNVAALQQHLGEVEALHHQDLQWGFGRAPLPDALARKYPNLDDF